MLSTGGATREQVPIREPRRKLSAGGRWAARRQARSIVAGGRNEAHSGSTSGHEARAGKGAFADADHALEGCRGERATAAHNIIDKPQRLCV
jgi:hypothetical protein